jgi:hypothetical protein
MKQRIRAWLTAETRSRRVILALGVYLIVAGVMLACAAPAVLTDHTPYNHFALQAQAWLQGDAHLEDGAPGYAGNNDFAQFKDRTFVAFPAFPAALLVPLVKFAGSAEGVRDGQFFIWLSGIGPAVLFLALEKLRRKGRSAHGERTHLLLSVLFAFGTVYFFTAVQGTVWFAAHVVAVALASLYLLFALDAERPLLAGLMLGLGFWTRTPLLFAFPLFALEALRVSARSSSALTPGDETELDRGRVARWRAALQRCVSGIDWKALLGRYVSFAIPILACIALALWYNKLRFENPFDFGYQHLEIAWQSRMKKWGLFDYHFLGKNLGVAFTSLPWLGTGDVPFRINMHGLALWFTTPLYLWLVWPKDKRAPHLALWLTVAAVAVPTLFYQNTGWEQFGYRFSNDYAIFLFALLATGGRRFRMLFAICALWSVSVNAFGALSFHREGFAKYYYSQASQKTLYEAE